MIKLQVGDIVSSAFRFAFGEFLTLLRLSWIPLTIMTALSLFISPGLIQEATNAAESNQVTLGYGHVASFFAILALQYVCIATAIVTYTEHALNVPLGQKFLYLPSVRMVGKVLASWLLVGLALVPALILASGAVYLSALAGRTSSGMERPGAGFISTLVLFAVIGTAFYAFVRLTFVLTPLVVAEGKIDLRRAWDLGRGNFWRYITIALGLALPFIVVSLGLSFIFVKLFAMPASALDPAQTAAERQQAILAWRTLATAQMRMLWPLISAANICAYVIMYGASAGASAFVYRALVPASQAQQSDA